MSCMCPRDCEMYLNNTLLASATSFSLPFSHLYIRIYISMNTYTSCTSMLPITNVTSRVHICIRSCIQIYNTWISFAPLFKSFHSLSPLISLPPLPSPHLAGSAVLCWRYCGWVVSVSPVFKWHINIMTRSLTEGCLAGLIKPRHLIFSRSGLLNDAALTRDSSRAEKGEGWQDGAEKLQEYLFYQEYLFFSIRRPFFS